MIWHENNKVKISFDKVPKVCVRYFVPFMSDEERKSIEKYPFINKADLKVVITDKKLDLDYIFTIPKGYCFDGASIPKGFWNLIGAPTDNRFLIPAMVHDTLCEHHNYINCDRALSTNVFNALLEASEVNPLKRCVMKNAVACFQSLLCGWK